MERSRDTGQSSRAERTHHGDDVIRRRAESSRRNDAELSVRPMKKPRLNETEAARAQAIERGRAKMQEYQQEAKRYQKEDRDTFEEFKNIFEGNIIDHINYGVKVLSKNRYHGIYENEINVEKGTILGIKNYHFLKKKIHFSEIVFNQLRLAMESLNKKISHFDLKCWYGQDVRNINTKKTVELFFPKERGKEEKKTFFAGTDAFIALAGTPTAQSKFYLLAQHPKAFPGKEVTSITVIRHSDGQIDIEYEFGSQLEQQKRPAPKTSL